MLKRTWIVALVSHLAWAADDGTLPAAEWDVKKLDSLLAEQQYQQIYTEIKAYSLPNPSYDPNSAHELEVINWMRRHQDEWHPAILLMLSNKDYDQIAPTSGGNHGNPSFNEMAQALARAMTSFQMDRANCIARNATSRDLAMRVRAISCRMINAVQRTPKSVRR